MIDIDIQISKSERSSGWATNKGGGDIICFRDALILNKLANSKDALPCGETYGLR